MSMYFFSPFLNYCRTYSVYCCGLGNKKFTWAFFFGELCSIQCCSFSLYTTKKISLYTTKKIYLLSLFLVGFFFFFFVCLLEGGRVIL